MQIAKSFGAEVTGVCSTTKVDMVRSLGADHVIDYTQEDFTQSRQQYDLILVMGGNHSLSQLKQVLRPGGTLVPVGTEAGNRWVGGKAWIQAMLLSRLKRHLRPLATQPNQADLQFVAELIEAGKIRPVIDKTFPLSEVPEAIRYLTAGHARERSSSPCEARTNTDHSPSRRTESALPTLRRQTMQNQSIQAIPGGLWDARGSIVKGFTPV